MAVDASRDAVLVQEFVNTRDLRSFVPRGHPFRDGTRDDIGSPETLRAWLHDHNLISGRERVSAADHARVLELRAALRTALDRTRAGEADPGVAFAAPLRVEVDPAEGPLVVSPIAGVDHALGEICAAALRTAFTGEWWRLRACAADDCQWVFYDQSKPGRGRYCAPDSCGNRVKTRAYRRRRADAAEG